MTYDLQVGQVSANTNVGCHDVGVSSSPSNKATCSFLVRFLLILSIETFDVNKDMVFKCVRLVQILLFVSLMWAYLPRPAIRPFVHSLVHLLLLLATETFNVSENMIFKCVSFVQSLTLDVFIWACLPCQAVRPFIHF